MTEWRIEPDKVDSVIARTSDGRTALAEVFTQEVVDQVGAGLGWSPELAGDVVVAVSELVTVGFGDFQAILGTVDAGIVGVYSAARAYFDAGTEMAGTFETAAVTASADNNLSYFEQNGYFD